MREYTRIDDWDDAYANRDHIDNAETFLERWETEAPKFRGEWGAVEGQVELDLVYGENPRERFDLFHPEKRKFSTPKGLFVFVHGGYWMLFDKSYWSHMAQAALVQGFAVAMPSYPLCPEVKISDITASIAKAIEAAAAKIAGPIILAGHSAGGHLVVRMGCEASLLSALVGARIQRIISISGVHDLRPLLRLKLNETLLLDEAQAEAESPVLLSPRQGIEIECIVGGNERPEFIRQNALMANIWIGMGAATKEVVIAGHHHFSIIEELADGKSGWLNLEL